MVDQAAPAPTGPPGFDFPNPLFPPAFHPPQQSAGLDGTPSVRPTDSLLDIGAFERAPDSVPGDLNDDGIANIADTIIALKVLAGLDAAGLRQDFPSSGADIGGDGRVGLAEAVFGLRITVAGDD
jgi:hypothetical protein